MKNISSYEDFEVAVLKEVFCDIYSTAIQCAFLGDVVSDLFGELAEAAISPSVNLNTEMYLNYLEKEYKERFEKNKHDSRYVQSLINEAINKIRTLK